MEQYGEYEVVRQIPRVATSRIFTLIARRTTVAAGGEAVVRVFPLEESLADASPGEADLDELSASGRLAFLQSIKHQQVAHRAGAANIAPVHEVGNDHRGVWYVSDYYPRGTLKKLIVGQYQADEEDLYHLVDSVLHGLLDLQQHCGRSHGRLIPNSILLGGPEGKRLRYATILLSEPLSGGTEKAAAYEVADLHALGEIIYQLVRRREVRAATQWPLPAAEEWSRLGPQGEGWRELCNALLDPALTQESFNFERLRADLPSLRPAQSAVQLFGERLANLARRLRPPRLSTVQVGSVAGGLALLVVAGIAFHAWRSRRVLAPVPVPAEQTNATPEPVQAPPVVPVPAAPVPVAPVPVVPAPVATAPATNVTARIPVAPEVPPPPPPPTTGTLELTTVPAGAGVFQDKRFLGRTPWRTDEPPGRVSYELRWEGRPPTNITAFIKAGETRALSVQAPPPIDLTVPVTLRTDPAGVEILVDGQSVGWTPLAPALRLRPGDYELTARYRDWPEQTQHLVVERSSAPVVAFAFVPGGVTLRSDPAGATVRRGGKELGRTPWTDEAVKPGPVTYELRKEGYFPAVLSTNVAGRQAVVLAEKLVSLSEYGMLVLTSDPAGAEFFVNGHSLGQRPQPVRWPVLPQTCEVSARFRDWPEVKLRPLPVARGELWDAPVRFAHGEVVLTSDPPGATVRLGGRELGQTPFTHLLGEADLKSLGGHAAYRFELAGYEPEVAEVEPGLNKKLMVKTKLHKEAPAR